MSRRKQLGFGAPDLSGLVTILFVIGIVFGVAIWELLQWLWPFVKSFIHAAAA